MWCKQICCYVNVFICLKEFRFNQICESLPSMSYISTADSCLCWSNQPCYPYSNSCIYITIHINTFLYSQSPPMSTSIKPSLMAVGTTVRSDETHLRVTLLPHAWFKTECILLLEKCVCDIECVWKKKHVFIAIRRIILYPFS